MKIYRVERHCPGCGEAHSYGTLDELARHYGVKCDPGQFRRCYDPRTGATYEYTTPATIEALIDTITRRDEIIFTWCRHTYTHREGVMDDADV